MSITEKNTQMKSERRIIQEKLRKFMEDSNGKGAWKPYYDSQLEEDVVKFTMKILKQHDTTN